MFGHTFVYHDRRAGIPSLLLFNFYPTLLFCDDSQINVEYPVTISLTHNYVDASNVVDAALGAKAHTTKRPMLERCLKLALF